MPMPPVAFFFLGYLLGSIPFGLLLTRVAGLGDIRTIGSGNIGATNVLRTGRKGLAVATLLLDALKGAAAVLIAGSLLGESAALWAGFGAVIGHLFPVWLGFQGGKGAATGFGVGLAVAWPVGLLAGAIWILVAAVFRLSSLATLVSFAAAPFLALGLADWGVVKLAFILAVLVFARHHANIRRLLAGTEPRIGQHKRAAPTDKA
ncbi:MAG TPA: glycerol-3-phosphate 1-O-acyltransferase PlsY [Acetobacteraceae bacterium]|nr:glycerol-3-phosphate 1-O-acyltransferase PlsY [Acetobacteraceae bacterium]